MEDETQTDGFPTNQDATNSGSHARPAMEPEDKQLEWYDLTKNRIMLIFNHEHYRIKSTSFFGGASLPSRHGTARDKESLINVFGYLKFNVTVYNDLSRDEILKVLEDFVNRDHKETSCVVVAILTHGCKDGVLYAYDGPYNINLVMTQFENKNLLQIPKMFLIQACRGKNADEGQYVQLDGGNARFKIPTHGDVLVLYSTVEGYVSYREQNGSWMIQTFCKVLREFHGDMDIHHIITLVNSRISQLESYSLNPAVHDKKQTAETRHTLTKILKF